MPDRFEQVHFERQPLEVGECEACDEIIYDYENTKCEMCEAQVHQKCTCRCGHCGKAGCKVCMKDEDGLMICYGCLGKRKNILEAIKNNFIPITHDFVGQKVTDDQIILEFVSTDNPKIYVHIDKRENK
jgi:hypothetical protein